jgi:hypothetical protein
MKGAMLQKIQNLATSIHPLIPRRINDIDGMIPARLL